MATSSDTLGELEQLTMLAVLRLGKAAYGAAIQRDLETTARRSVTIATIYVTLTRLERKGHVTSHRTDPTPVPGGKAKRVFAVTRRGHRALVEARESLARMWRGVDEEPGMGPADS